MDALTPLARGQCLLLTGAQGAGKTTTALDAILGQQTSGVGLRLCSHCRSVSCCRHSCCSRLVQAPPAWPAELGPAAKPTCMSGPAALICTCSANMSRTGSATHLALAADPVWLVQAGW